MTRDGVQVLGLCRFSYPSAPGAFSRVEGGDLAAIRAQLYAPERLALRLHLLEHLMLPGLRAQTDSDFTLLLMMGDDLPGPVRDRVLRLIADLPQIKPVFWPEGQPHREAVREVMLAHRDPDARLIAEFRLDDDDAIAVDFVAETRRLQQAMRGLFRRQRAVALDFNKGIALHLGQGPARPEAVSARYWTPALVLFLKPNNARSLLDYPHMRLWRRLPTVTIPDQFMFIRGIHGDNDSNVGNTLHQADRIDLPEDISGLLRDRFRVDLASL